MVVGVSQKWRFFWLGNFFVTRYITRSKVGVLEE
jgi:hypothetical protein